MALVNKLGLSGNPFEHYTAETEPNIASYAVRPPYLETISNRACGLSSFILLGDRGAGKSATRITVYSEIWKLCAENKKGPLALNMTDFSLLLEDFGKGKLSDKDIVRSTAFFVVEQVLIWLSSLEEDDRAVYIDGLDKDERTLVFALIKGFYLPVNDMDRSVSTGEALRLLNSAWMTKSAVWVSQRWDALSKIVASAINAFSKKEMGDSVDISVPAEMLLESLVGENPNAARAVLNKLVEFVKAFGFTGVCVLVDKVDETPATSSSAEATARLIYPLLSHIQLLEVSGFSWLFFLWSNVQSHFNEKYPVRLDKIAHANITWDANSLRTMIDARLRFYSKNHISFADIFIDGTDADVVFQQLVRISVKSPRELIKLMDIIFREHDAKGSDAPDLIDQESLTIGQDKYARETIGAWYANKPLLQVLRLGMIDFVNRDVQAAFKIGDQGARVKINSWEDSGLVRQNGTAPSELGGKQVYRYCVADSRVQRIIERRLDDLVGSGIAGQEAV